MPITKTNVKKNGLQKYIVRVNYTDIYGAYQRIERTAYGKAEAQALEQQLRRQVSEKANPSRMSLGELIDDYFAAMKNDLRETTLDKKTRSLRLSVSDALRATRLDQLNTRVLQQWKNEINQRPLSIVSKQNFYRDFNSVLNYAVKHSYLPRNPLPLVGNFKDVYTVADAPEALQYYTAEEALRFLTEAEKAAAQKSAASEWGYYVFFCLAFYMGMRKGEINALRWSDIDGPILHVRRSIAQKLKGDDRETPPKNKSSYRTLQIPEPMQSILKEHLARQQADSRFSTDFRVCGGPSVLRDTSIENRNKQYAAGAGLPHIRVHDFRHTHATLLINEGINIQEIARRLGHSDVQTTWKVYAHLYPREEDRAVAILNKIQIR